MQQCVRIWLTSKTFFIGSEVCESFTRSTFTTPKIRTFTTPKFGHLPPPKTDTTTSYLMCSMTTTSSTSSFQSLMSSMSCKSKKPGKVRQKKWGWQLSSWQMFFFGGGKCPNFGMVNVRILGVVNVLLANDSQS